MGRGPPVHGDIPAPRHHETTELPVLHRLAVAYLVLPLVVWLLGWFHWWLGIPVAAALVAGLWRTMSGSWRISVRPATLVLLLMAIAWVMLTAAGGFFDVRNPDWIKHRSVLTDLALRDWPVRLPDPLTAFLSGNGHAEPDALLRYYLGWYVVPALAGHWFGIAALNWAVPVWTWGGVALLVLLFTRRFARIGPAIVAVVVLGCFSGMDYLRVLLLSGEAVPLPYNRHLEANALLLDAIPAPQGGPPRIQYSSNTTALMWVPTHFLASGLCTMLLLQLRRQPRFLASSGVVFAACLFWSPFVAIGLVPLIIVTLMDNGLRPFLRWQNILCAAPLVLLLVVFLVGGTSDIPHGWLWSKSDWGELAYWAELAYKLAIFYLAEFLILALLLWRCQPQVWRERPFVASVAALIVLPAYTFGYYNDLVMRASLPSLMVLCWYCAQAVSSLDLPTWRRNGAAERTPSTPRRMVSKGVLLASLIIGAITPLHELLRAARSFKDNQAYRYQHIIRSLSTSMPRHLWEQYAAEEGVVTGTLLKAQETGASGAIENWELVIRSEFDTYRNGKLLIHAKERCSETELADAVFLVEVWPEDIRDLPDNRRRLGFEQLLIDRLGTHLLWRGERCAFVHELPEYRVRKVTTGQIQQGRRLWFGEFSWPEPS